MDQLSQGHFSLPYEKQQELLKKSPEEILNQEFGEIIPSKNFLSKKVLDQMIKTCEVKYIELVSQYKFDRELGIRLQGEWEDLDEDVQRKLMNIKGSNPSANVSKPELQQADAIFNGFFQILGNLHQGKVTIEYLEKKVAYLNSIRKTYGWLDK